MFKTIRIAAPRLLGAGLALAAAIAAPAYAQDETNIHTDGHWQVKLLGTAVLPDGAVSSVRYNGISGTLPSSAIQTKANDNGVPTLAVEYFINRNISVETICCLTMHHVNGAGALAGTDILEHVLILPATLTLKAHLPLGPIKPYIGAGVTEFFTFGERPGTTTAALGATRAVLSNKFGEVVQAGVDIPLGKKGFGLSFDAKRYFVQPIAHFYAGDAEVLTTKHNLDPWVLSGGISYRF